MRSRGWLLLPFGGAVHSPLLRVVSQEDSDPSVPL